MSKNEASEKTISGSHGKIKIIQTEPGISRILISREGFSYKGLFTLLIILLWLFMIFFWTILLLQINVSWALISIPFWLLGLVTLRLSLRVIRSSQELEINDEETTIYKREGRKTAHITIKNQDIETIAFVEGSYKSLSGITKKGTYPAIIYNQEAYGFGERCTKGEKQFLTDNVKRIIDSGNPKK